MQFSSLQTLILAKKMKLRFKMTCCVYICLFIQILLDIRLIRELILSCCKLLLTTFKLLLKLFWVLKLPLTALGCSDINIRLLTYLDNKLFSHELKTFNYDGLWENKKFSDENQRFDWIKSIHGYRLVNID